MSKTPFELRMRLLEFAQSQLVSEYHAACDRFHFYKELDITPTVLPDLPKYPSKEDIVKLAEELKNFVDNK